MDRRHPNSTALGTKPGEGSSVLDEARTDLSCATHAILPLDRAMTAAMGLLFCVLGHVEEWPVAGKHTGYAYCHVPAGPTADLTQTIERQVERFAPGFRDRILARHIMSAADFERYNPSLVGGAITGGVADLAQLIGRPVVRWNPYTTPSPRIFLCSGSTPPGGGVHGMCGYHAARAALRRIERLPLGSLLG